MRYRIAVWLAVLCAGFAVAVSGQEGNAPQILSADLAPRQVVEEPELTVNFVVVDSDKVVKVTIDGKPETITPADTVLIEKKFRFKIGRTLVRVEAEDEKGNKRVREFLVAFGVPLEAEKVEEKPPEFTVKVLTKIRLEKDGNPSNDFGIPAFLESSVSEELRQGGEGAVNDADQEDDRTTLQAVVAMGFGQISGFVGFLDTSYSKTFYTNVESQAIFLGAQYNLGKPGEGGLRISGMLIDLDVGGSDFAVLTTPGVGFEIRSEDNEGTDNIFYGFELNQIDYADQLTSSGIPKTRDGTGFTLRRVRNLVDKPKQDTFKSIAAFGEHPGGASLIETTLEFDDPHRFLKYDADWENIWDSGFRWGIGYGVGYKKYFEDDQPLDPDLFGSTRVDLPFRFSTAVGWQFTRDFSAIYNFKYTVNLSNKRLFDRLIHGLVVKAAF